MAVPDQEQLEQVAKQCSFASIQLLIEPLGCRAGAPKASLIWVPDSRPEKIELSRCLSILR